MNCDYCKWTGKEDQLITRQNHKREFKKYCPKCGELPNKPLAEKPRSFREIYYDVQAWLLGLLPKR